MDHIEIIGSADAAPRPTPDPFPIGGLGAVLRRSIIACDRAQFLEDQLDCADMALELGYEDAARMLYEGAFVQRGFSLKQIAAQARIATRTGLWSEKAPGAHLPPAVAAEFAIDLALAELQQLVELAPELPLPPPPGAEVLDLLAGKPSSVDAGSGKRAHIVDAGLVKALTGRLCASLRANDISQLDMVLEEVQRDLLGQRRWDPRDHADASITELAAGVVASQLYAFFDRNHNLCWAPFGSSALFAAAARLPAGGMGPYFGNVTQLLRSAKDLIGLVLLAGVDDGSGRSSRFQRWLVLLATHLDRGDLTDLAEELADRGLDIALLGIFGAARHAAADRGSRLPWTVRDAALDLGWVDLAAQAQARIVGLSPDREEEWIVLAEVLGGNDSVAAQQALVEALRLAPEHEGALELSAALEAGDFGAFEVLSGIGSPPWRVALRAQHRRSNEQMDEMSL